MADALTRCRDNCCSNLTVCVNDWTRTMRVDEFTRKLFDVYKESLKSGPKVHLLSMCFAVSS